MLEKSVLEQERAAKRVLKKVPHNVIGARLRRERMAQGISIRDLATTAQLGKSSIVRLEAGEEFRAVTLLKICAALNLSVELLLTTSEVETVATHRREQDRWFELGAAKDGPLGGLDRGMAQGERKQLLLHGDKNLQLPFKSALPKGKVAPTMIEVFKKTEPESFPGEQFIYVLRGPVLIAVGDREYKLENGESMSFWGSEIHTYAAASAEPALIISVRVNSA